MRQPLGHQSAFELLLLFPLDPRKPSLIPRPSSTRKCPPLLCLRFRSQWTNPKPKAATTQRLRRGLSTKLKRISQKIFSKAEIVYFAGIDEGPSAAILSSVSRIAVRLTRMLPPVGVVSQYLRRWKKISSRSQEGTCITGENTYLLVIDDDLLSVLDIDSVCSL